MDFGLRGTLYRHNKYYQLATSSSYPPLSASPQSKSLSKTPPFPQGKYFDEVCRLNAWGECREGFEYLNYNDVHQEAGEPAALLHAGRSQSPPVPPQPLSQAEGVRKKILHYSYLLTDRIGKGYSSVVYRGLNESTGIDIPIQEVKWPSR